VTHEHLARRFLLTSLPVMILLAVGLGWWVTASIERQVIRNSAADLALYVQSFLSGSLQGLAERNRLNPGEIARVRRLFTNTPLGHRVRSLKIWKEGGVVVYATDPSLIGRRFPPTAHLRQAWKGTVGASLDELHAVENAPEQALGLPLLEVYSPVRFTGSDRVISVAEFYQDARPLEAELRATRLTTWLVVGGATVMAFGLLFLIVLQGERVIRQQRREMNDQVAQLSGLLQQNERLGVRLREAARRSATVNERQLRRVSAELHDGPAQTMSLALLRLEAILDSTHGCPAADGRPRVEEAVAEVRGALEHSLTEVRQISKGLALPELGGLAVSEVLSRAISAHEQRTGQQVEISTAGPVHAGVGTPISLTLYRVVQEALMNVFKHAGDASAAIGVILDGETLKVTIRDDGPGFVAAEAEARTDRLGLHGLRERVEALGGTFELETVLGVGTSIRAVLPAQTDGREMPDG